MQAIVAQKQKEVDQVAAREKAAQKKKEVVAKATADKEHVVKEATVEVEESASHHFKDNKLQKRTKETTFVPRKKQKSNKHSHVDPMILTEGDLDEIGDKVHDIITELQTQFEQENQQELGNVQKDLRQLHIQIGRVQESVRQVSGIQVSLQQVSATVLETFRTLDLRFIPLSEGSLCAQAEEANTQLTKFKDVGVNLAVLPIQTLHELHQGVPNKLRVRDQCTLLFISEVKMNNKKIFVEKAQVLKEKEELGTHSQNLEATITQACNALPELNIPENAASEVNIRKFSAAVRE